MEINNNPGQDGVTENPTKSRVSLITFSMKELSASQLRQIKGGVTPEEYCAILYNLILHHENEWTEQDWANALGGWDHYNCSEFYVIDFEVGEGGEN